MIVPARGIETRSTKMGGTECLVMRLLRYGNWRGDLRLLLQIQADGGRSLQGAEREALTSRTRPLSGIRQGS
ncbi:unnamed protein product [Linum trigynum]|uniref:Uncharacterized protein n=1 Tax=Linum trigynum TaxID=586398 RepID=A0AAV2EQX9_9ROSI